MSNLRKININDIQPGYTLGHADAAILREELRELLAYREAAGKPVAYSYKYAGCETCEGFQDWRDELSEEAPPEWMVETGKVTDLTPLYAATPLPADNSPEIPDGWALVPIDATPEMLNASWVHHGIHHPSAWRTMIAAAPKPNIDPDRA